MARNIRLEWAMHSVESEECEVPRYVLHVTCFRVWLLQIQKKP
jgi:hypothetical protein